MIRFFVLNGIAAATVLMLCTACTHTDSFPTTYLAGGGSYYAEPFDPS